MRYGLLGEKLGHSFSKEIHNSLGEYSYDLLEVSREKLKEFIESRTFSGLNVTIPYKEAVIPYLDRIDEAAKAIYNEFEEYFGKRECEIERYFNHCFFFNFMHYIIFDNSSNMEFVL